MRTPATAAAAMPAAPAHSHARRPPPRCAMPALVSVSRMPMIEYRSAGCGGSVWESNPPPTCLEPDAGFEVREAHRDPRRFREAKYLSDQRKECTTAGLACEQVSPLMLTNVDSREEEPWTTQR